VNPAAEANRFGGQFSKRGGDLGVGMVGHRLVEDTLILPDHVPDVVLLAAVARIDVLVEDRVVIGHAQIPGPYFTGSFEDFRPGRADSIARLMEQLVCLVEGVGAGEEAPLVLTEGGLRLPRRPSRSTTRVCPVPAGPRDRVP